MMACAKAHFRRYNDLMRNIFHRFMKFCPDDAKIADGHRLKIAFPDFIPVPFFNSASGEGIAFQQLIYFIAFEGMLIKIGNEVIVLLFEAFGAQVGRPGRTNG
jgi:hypothetical protein